jgi:hypothetical protein
MGIDVERKTPVYNTCEVLPATEPSKLAALVRRMCASALSIGYGIPLDAVPFMIG